MLTLCIGHGRKTEGKKVRTLAQRPDLCLVHAGKTGKLSYNYHRDFKENAQKVGQCKSKPRGMWSGRPLSAINVAENGYQSLYVSSKLFSSLK